MRILNVHNRHAGAGGSEIVFESISTLLRARGHTVIELARDNAALRSLWQKVTAFGSAVYSFAAHREMTALLRDERPDVVHAHNLYPQLSVSLLDACRDAGVPVVLHVHDYKFTCPTAQHLRAGRVCDKCTGGREHWCALHNCRGSLPMSVAYAVRNAFVRGSGKLDAGAGLFLCASDFVRRLLLSNGFNPGRCVTLHNFVDLPAFDPASRFDGGYAAYVGRISPEKGIDVLLAAARRTGLPVRIAGDPAGYPGAMDRAPGNVRFVGRLDRAGTASLLAGARMLVAPSIWWEVFGLVAAEAMSREVPVIATSMGGLPEVVEHGRTGLLVAPNDAGALADAMEQLWSLSPAERAAMGRAGREKVVRQFSPDVFYANLMRAYARVTPAAGRHHTEKHAA